MNKKALVAAAVIAAVGFGVLGSTTVFAQNALSPMSSLVQKIADKFGLKTSDVQAVFDADKTDRQAQMEAKYETHLSQLVTDGKITETQKQLILAKHKELLANRQAQFDKTKTMTLAERKSYMQSQKSAMQSERSALQSWATANGIDIKYLFGGFGMRMGPGRMMGRMNGFR